MSEDILEIPIVEEGTCIFNHGDRYIVPIYQRAFAWGTGDSVGHNEIIQLMDDVYDSDADTYRLGSLIVARRNANEYEIIDGQQRLTALFLILSQLGLPVETGSLSYACRPTAATVLERISKGSFDLGDGVPDSDPASGIVAGVRAIKEKIDAQTDRDGYKRKLLDQFKNTLLCRIVVPEKTDLNRYFEIMNTRGEQLEPQDIVKAHLMGTLDGDGEKSAFATVWDACADMEGYCQMHILDTDMRRSIFGDNWTELTKAYSQGARLLEAIGGADAEPKEQDVPLPTFYQLVTSKHDALSEKEHGDQYSRFESIIDFRHFLLHSLNVFLGKPKGTLDDSKLIDEFKRALKQYKGQAGDFARSFILNLLKCRYLFDRYVIKRIYDANGRSEWSLNELCSNSDGGPSYRQTVFSDESDGDVEHADVLMLEACMRVTYLDPKRMYWLTQLLQHLAGCKSVSAKRVARLLKNIAQLEIDDFINNNDFCMGVATPHIVFNYLDYLLWVRQDEVEEYFKIKDFAKGFAFEYRSSVEHWYPRNPPDGSVFPLLNHFGNLCILRGDINTKFSNLTPKSKQQDREQYIRLEHQSLKLRLMAIITERDKWDETTCGDHENMMLRVLRGESLTA